MHAFTDGLGRAWEVVIDLFTIEKVQVHTGLDVFDVKAVCASMPTFVHVLYRLCSDQAEGKFTERDFFRGITPEFFDVARAAFRDELIFFCQTEAKEDLRKMFDLVEEVEEKTLSLLQSQSKTEMEKVKNLDTDHLAQVMVKELLREMSSDSPINSPDRSVLTRVG